MYEKNTNILAISIYFHLITAVMVHVKKALSVQAGSFYILLSTCRSPCFLPRWLVSELLWSKSIIFVMIDSKVYCNNCDETVERHQYPCVNVPWTLSIHFIFYKTWHFFPDKPTLNMRLFLWFQQCSLENEILFRLLFY